MLIHRGKRMSRWSKTWQILALWTIFVSTTVYLVFQSFTKIGDIVVNSPAVDFDGFAKAQSEFDIEYVERSYCPQAATLTINVGKNVL